MDAENYWVYNPKIKFAPYICLLVYTFQFFCKHNNLLKVKSVQFLISCYCTSIRKHGTALRVAFSSFLYISEEIFNFGLDILIFSSKI